MIHEEIVTHEVAKLAKDKGFDWGCLYHYDYKGSLHQHYAYDAMNSGVGVDNLLMYDGHLFTSECLAPTQSLLQRWLREERGVIVEVFMDDDSNMPLTYNIHQYKDWNWQCVCHHHGNYYAVNDWELCLEDALKYALENLL